LGGGVAREIVGAVVEEMVAVSTVLAAAVMTED
jgi:hypothetical protein